jgi:phosphoglycolate phosphatase-like HAD superfamily hydrolase
VTDRPLAIVDIDGVVADVRHRLHHLESRPKNWDGFFADAGADPPHEEGVALVVKLAAEHDIVFLTGRPNRLRSVTQKWLDEQGLGGHGLVMRSHRDFRPAARAKVELLRELSEGREVAIVVDDDLVVLAAMKDAGYPTLHADWESRSPEADATLLTAQEVEGRT